MRNAITQNRPVVVYLVVVGPNVRALTYTVNHNPADVDFHCDQMRRLALSFPSPSDCADAAAAAAAASSLAKKLNVGGGMQQRKSAPSGGQQRLLRRNASSGSTPQRGESPANWQGSKTTKAASSSSANRTSPNGTDADSFPGANSSVQWPRNYGFHTCRTKATHLRLDYVSALGDVRYRVQDSIFMSFFRAYLVGFIPALIAHVSVFINLTRPITQLSRNFFAII